MLKKVSDVSYWSELRYSLQFHRKLWKNFKILYTDVFIS